jgi:hypothetical protein
VVQQWPAPIEIGQLRYGPSIFPEVVAFSRSVFAGKLSHLFVADETEYSRHNLPDQVQGRAAAGCAELLGVADARTPKVTASTTPLVALCLSRLPTSRMRDLFIR